MNIIKVKDFDSMQSITVSLARNGYLVTANSITDENYKDYWEIKYCEFSEIKEKPVNNGGNCCDEDCGLSLDSMEIHNNDNTKGVKCEILQDEKPLIENEKEIINTNPYGLMPRDNTPDIKSIPQQDVSYNIKEAKRRLLPDVKID